MEIQSVSTHSPRRDNKHAKENHKNTSKSLRKIRIKIPLVKKKKKQNKSMNEKFSKVHWKHTLQKLCMYYKTAL